MKIKATARDRRTGKTQTWIFTYEEKSPYILAIAAEINKAMWVLENDEMELISVEEVKEKGPEGP